MPDALKSLRRYGILLRTPGIPASVNALMEVVRRLPRPAVTSVMLATVSSSACYLQRMLRLVLMKHGGLSISLGSSIDWDTSSIRWKNGVVTVVDDYQPPDPPRRNKRAIKTPGGDTPD